MSQVHLATVKDGQIQLINPVLLPEGAKILVTVLESENNPQTVGDWEQWLLFEETSQQLQSEEYLDSLTKIGNDHYFDNYLAQSWQQHKTRSQPIALIFIDIDFFQPYYYEYKTKQANDCLVVVAQCIANVPKQLMSVVARYGRDEFAVILPNTTIDDALIVAESIRNAVSSLAIPNSGYYEEVGSYLTISLGVASIVPSEETILKDFMKTAERAVLRAKDQGRDQVFTFDLDQLTQVDSRRCFDGYVEKVWQHSKRTQQFLSLILIGINYFRKYKAHYGYEEGDKCLVNIAKIITKATKNKDYFIARYGEDEFALLLLDTNIKEALIIAESIKQAIAELVIPHADPSVIDHIKFGIGVSTFIPNEGEEERSRDLIRKAERSLFDANCHLISSIEFFGSAPLTRLLNRKYCDDYLEYFWQKQKREEQPLSLILINIDRFKKYNDRYGYLKGNDCLTAIAQAITKALPRPTDLAFRYAGDEFTVLLPNTNVNSTFSMAESIKKEIDSLAIPHADSDVNGYLTVSIGVATLIPNDESKAFDLLQKAETAHYEIRGCRGRNPNQICSKDLDGLTQLANRRYFDHYLTQIWQKHQRSQQFLSLILIDIDYLKKYNDRYGLGEGEKCLIRIAQCLAKLPQISTNLIARFGGEEFTVILPHTKMDNALNVAESIREAVLALTIPHSESDVSDYVTVSLGVSTFIAREKNSPHDLIRTADIALYQAKQTGRNQVLGLGLDELTQLPNRQFFDNCLAKTWQHYQRLNLAVALILVTVDYFKKYQEHYGNEEADNCLVSIAQAIAKLCKRNYERLVARYDEDTFRIFLPNTNSEDASVIAESIKQAVASLEIPNISYPQAGSLVSVSLGFSSLIPSPENALENLINTAEITILTLQNQGHDQIFSTDIDELLRQDNRQYFREYLTQAWQQHQSANQPLGLILVDIDYMNAYCCYHVCQNHDGLQKTNDYLINIAKAIAKILKDRPHLIARYNGENIGGEFAILLPNTNLEEVFALAESITTSIPSWPPFPIPGYSVFGGGSLEMTKRLGGSSLIPNPENAPQDLINEANRFLFLNQYGELNLQYSSDINGFTTLPNRQGLYNYLAPLWQQYLEKQQYVTLILVNIDLLKHFNNLYSHQNGDQCILSVAQAIDQLFKKQQMVGFVAHYEGGIFSIILPESDLNQASTLAELIRTQVASHAIPISSNLSIYNIDFVLNNPNVKLAPFLMTNETSHANSYVTYVTVSLGITQLIPNSENCPNDLFKKGNLALYHTKEEGRNTVITVY